MPSTTDIVIGELNPIVSTRVHVAGETEIYDRALVEDVWHESVGECVSVDLQILVLRNCWQSSHAQGMYLSIPWTLFGPVYYHLR